MNTDKLREIYRKYNLGDGDYYKHKHYVIITRQGIQKIERMADITVNFHILNSERDFASLHAFGEFNLEGGKTKKYQTLASALHGEKVLIDGKWKETGTTNSWYVLEIAEKRARARTVLSLVGLYEEGAFSEEESEEFIEKNSDKTKQKGTSAVEVAISKTKKK
jgi:calcineurin-like phosphoesterase family protein